MGYYLRGQGRDRREARAKETRKRRMENEDRDERKKDGRRERTNREEKDESEVTHARKNRMGGKIDHAPEGQEKGRKETEIQWNDVNI